jgi:RNA recognition motif-containing protein
MNIFVAKLSPKTTNETLTTLFQEYGTVESAKVIFDRDSGRSKCFGFVEMPNEEEGNQAITDLDGTEFEASTIVVKIARPKEGNDRSQGGGRRSFNKY